MFLDDFATVDSGADSYAWFHLAMVYHQLGKTDEALAMFDQAIRWMEAKKPDNAELAALRDEAARLFANSEQLSVQSEDSSNTLAPGEEALPDSNPAEVR